MDNVKGVLLLLVLLLGAATFFLFIQNRSLSSQVSDATQLSGAALSLLKLQEVHCSASQAQFSKITDCVMPLLREADFKQDSFAQPKNGEPGYLVIKNTNHRQYEAEKFTFFFNRAPLQTGCTIPGTIDYNVVCRADFSTNCDDGDIIEAFYPVNGTDRRIFLKTC